MFANCRIKNHTVLWIPFSLYAAKMETRSKGGSVAEVLRNLNLSAQNFTIHQEKTLRALTYCRTSALGGHIDACMVAETFPSVTTRVGIGIARNVKVIKRKNGSRNASRNCCRAVIITWFLLCPKN